MSRAVSQDARVEAQAPWADDAAQVAKQLGVDPETGLRRGEARRRRQRYGPNELRRVARRSLSAILLDQFRNLIVVLLTAAAAVAFAFGELPEAVAIAVVILLNGTIGFLTEWRAVRAMEALRALSRVTATVVRDGRPVRLPAASLVPGDVVLF
jgi:Ca2+-transporting ATPase